MSKVILLSRVSSEHQTLEQQTNELINEAGRLGYSKSNIIIIENKESAISLDEEERRGLIKLKEVIEKDSNVNCVVCYEVSRLSRKSKVLFSIRDYLIDRQIQLVIMKPYMKLLDSDGKMSQTASIMFSLFASLSESEMMIKKERLRRGKRQAMRDGKYIGGYTPFGYTFINNHLEVDTKQAEIVKKIYNMYLSGYSLRKLGTELLETGEIPAKSKGAAAAMMGFILSKPRYCGEAEEGLEYKYPAIVSKEMFEQAREIAKKNRKAPKSIVSMVYFCRGILRNGVDNRALTPSKAERIYATHNYNKDNHLSVSINTMDSLIWQVVSEYLIYKAPKDNDKYKMELTEQVSTLKKKLKTSKHNKSDLNKQLDRIEKRIIEGKLEENKGDAMEKEIEDQIKEIRNKENEWLNEIHIKETEIKQLDDDTLYMMRDLTTLNDDERYALIQKTIENMFIWKTEKRGTYKIEFHFKNGIIKTFTCLSQSKYPKYWDEYGELYYVNRLTRVTVKHKYIRKTPEKTV